MIRYSSINPECHFLLSIPLKPFLLFIHIQLMLALDFSHPIPGSCQDNSNIFRDSSQIYGQDSGTGVALGDLDGDGDVDAFVTNGFRSQESNRIWINQGDGTFVEGQQFAADESNAVALGDLDGDGDIDAYVANNGENTVWLNNQIPQSNSELVDHPVSGIDPVNSLGVALGDLDGDNGLDAVVVGSFTNGVQIRFNSGNGEFFPGPDLSTTGFPLYEDVAIGDLDNDGDLDIVLADASIGMNRIWWNRLDENNEFVEGPLLNTENVAQAVSIADLDGDNFLDIAVATAGTNPIWWNQRDLTFTASSAIVPDNETDIALGDLDGDGDIDAFITHRITTNLPDRVWLNNGNRTFTLHDQMLGFSTSFAVALSDLNGDRKLDAFVAGGGGNSVWINQTDDSNGDTTGNGIFFDSGQLFDAVSSTDVALGDIDNDGDLDAVVSYETEVSVLWLNGEDGPIGTFSKSNQQFGIFSNDYAALGDVDNDGDLDILFSFSGLWINEGGNQGGSLSTFRDSNHEFIAGEVLFGDIDQDNDLDILIENGIVYVYINGHNGDPIGNFTEIGTISLNRYANHIDIGDLDGDEDLDIFVATNNENEIWFNVGDGFIQSDQQLGDFETQRIELGDIDNDGDLDAFLLNEDRDTDIKFSQIWFNGEFGNPQGIFSYSGRDFGSRHTGVALGDLDGDGDLDAYITAKGNEYEGDPDEVWINQGDASGFFTVLDQCIGVSRSESVALGDLDNDGDLDAFVVHGSIRTSSTTVIYQPDKIWFNGRGQSCLCLFEALFGSNVDQSVTTNSQAAKKLKAQQSLFDLNFYYRIRDELFSKTSSGRQLIDLYYTHNPEVFRLFLSDETLQLGALPLLQQWQPIFQAMLDDHAIAETVSAELIQATRSFFNSLSAVASPDLQQAISNQLESYNRLDDLIGLAPDELASILGFIPRSNTTISEYR